MNNELLYFMQKTLIKEKEGTILDVNDNFSNLTQFSKNNLCRKNITAVLNELFRCNHKLNITDEEIHTVLFTKTLNGKIELESEPDIGSTFGINLPANESLKKNYLKFSFKL